MTNNHSYRYCVVDVFTEVPFEGNALAVFPNALGMPEDAMQRIAREMNLSETVFVFPPSRPDAVAAFRIFTPAQELLFAGHPTVGGSFVLLQEGIVPKGSERFVLEEKVGLVPIRVESGDRPLIWLTTPPISFGPTFERARCAAALGVETDELIDIPPQMVSAGNPFFFIAVKNKETVDRAFLDSTGAKNIKGPEIDASGVFVFAPTAEGAYSRMFAPEYGITEDPATGSATGPLAAYMVRHKLLPSSSPSRFINEQGVKMGRRSILHVQLHGDGGAEGIEIGGHVVPVVTSATLQF
jgi:trans-2,3-dihydro-3-hydroxyanthranilate isomerase